MIVFTVVGWCCFEHSVVHIQCVVITQERCGQPAVYNTIVQCKRQSTVDVYIID